MKSPGPAVVLVQPRIPQNVGAVGRLCAAARAQLHVVRPIPFQLDDRSLRRAGMDYLELLDWQVHADWEQCRRVLAPRRTWFLTSSGQRSLYDITFAASDVLVFGSEVAGLPEGIRAEFSANDIRIPLPEPQARCLNLATSVGIALWELLRQAE